MNADEFSNLKRILESPGKELTGGVLAEMSITTPAAHDLLRKVAVTGGVVEAFDYFLKCYSDHMAEKLVGYDNWIDPAYPAQHYGPKSTS